MLSGPVYAELCGLPRQSPADVDRLLADARITVDFEIGRPIWEKAASSYSAYCDRRRKSGGGAPRRLVTDFLIGATPSSPLTA